MNQNSGGGKQVIDGVTIEPSKTALQERAYYTASINRNQNDGGRRVHQNAGSNQVVIDDEVIEGTVTSTDDGINIGGKNVHQNSGGNQVVVGDKVVEPTSTA